MLNSNDIVELNLNSNGMIVKICVSILIHDLGEKTRTQRVWVRVLFYHPNSLWVWVQVVISGACLGSVKPILVDARCYPYL
jgi:hypothetical protein